jgi:hypothetical protein
MHFQILWSADLHPMPAVAGDAELRRVPPVVIDLAVAASERERHFTDLDAVCPE